MLKKITYINSMIACLLALLVLMLVYKKEPAVINDAITLVVLILMAIGFVMAVAIFTQLIGRSVTGVVWSTRLLIIMSVLWGLGCAIFFEPWYYDTTFDEYINLSYFIISGILPIVILWGIVWVTSAAIKE